MNSSLRTSTIVLLFLACILGIAGTAILARACSTAERATFEPVEHEIDRQNVEQSRTFREGLRRDFDSLMLAYAQAKTDDERATIIATLRHRVQGAPPEAVPDDVTQFLAHH